MLSPNPTTVNGTNSVFVYTCAFGFIGPAVTVQRSAVDGTWSSAGGAVSCVTCSASQFSLGGTQCIDIPVLTPLTPPNVVVAPPVAAAAGLQRRDAELLVGSNTRLAGCCASSRSAFLLTCAYFSFSPS